MSLKLYMDHNLRAAITKGVRRQDVDVITALQDGHNRTRDPLVLDRSTELGRVLVTEDKDFLKITAQRQKTGKHFAGVIYFAQRNPAIGKLIEEIEYICKIYTPDEIADTLVRLPLGLFAN